MRQLIGGVLVLALAVVLTWFVIQDPGYVVLARDPWRVEIALSLFVLLFLGVFIGLYLLLRFLTKVWRTPKALKLWRRQKLLRSAQKSMANGSLSLIEGDWKKAEKQLVNSLHDSSNPVLGYLAAAYSAHNAGNTAKRDEYVAEASQEYPKQKLAIGLVQAHLQYRSGELSRACETLRRLHANAHRNVQVLRLLGKVYVDMKEWKELLQLLPLLRRMEVLPTKELDEYEVQACCSLLVVDQKNDRGKALDKIWKSFSSRQRQHAEIITAYVHVSIELGRDEQCETLLRSAINRQWIGKLVYLYGKLHTDNSMAQFKTAEAWSLSHPVDPDLLLTLGRLATQNKLWGKARSYLETCIASDGSLEAFDELGHLLEQLGETQGALECYRQGIAQSFGADHSTAKFKGSVDIATPRIQVVR